MFIVKLYVDIQSVQRDKYEYGLLGHLRLGGAQVYLRSGSYHTAQHTLATRPHIVVVDPQGR